MRYIRNDSKNPYFNLALEEYVLKYLDGEFFILWQNRPSVIIGKHQNTIEEVNMKYVNENGIRVVRRLSGGGAVYHDLGNVNFTFIVDDVEKEILDFKVYTMPVIAALKRLGVEAQTSGRNDLTINGKKISGNAQYLYKNRLLHHGTLLFDTDLDGLEAALNVSRDKIQSKGIKSVRSRVTNIKDYISDKITVSEFMDLLVQHIFEFIGKGYSEYKLTGTDMENINRIMKEKYLKWEWNFGESPPFNFRNSQRFRGGKVDILLEVKNGIIDECKIYGDFLGVADVGEIEERIKGKKYTESDVSSAINGLDIYKYFGDITKGELLSCFFETIN